DRSRAPPTPALRRHARHPTTPQPPPLRLPSAPTTTRPPRALPDQGPLPRTQQPRPDPPLPRRPHPVRARAPPQAHRPALPRHRHGPPRPQVDRAPPRSPTRQRHRLALSMTPSKGTRMPRSDLLEAMQHGQARAGDHPIDITPTPDGRLTYTITHIEGAHLATATREHDTFDETLMHALGHLAHELREHAGGDD